MAFKKTNEAVKRNSGKVGNCKYQTGGKNGCIVGNCERKTGVVTAGIRKTLKNLDNPN